MKKETAPRLQTPFGQPASLLLLIENARKGALCLSLKNDVPKAELGI